MSNFEIARKFKLPNGGTITVTVSSPEPIPENDFMILRPQAALEMGQCLMDLAEAMSPIKSGGDRR